MGSFLFVYYLMKQLRGKPQEYEVFCTLIYALFTFKKFKWIFWKKHQENIALRKKTTIGA